MCHQLRKSFKENFPKNTTAIIVRIAIGLRRIASKLKLMLQTCSYEFYTIFFWIDKPITMQYFVAIICSLIQKNYQYTSVRRCDYKA